MSKQTCFCIRRCCRPTAPEAPPEIRTIFDRYSDGSGVMKASHLRSFLVEVQREENTIEEEAQAIIDGHNHKHLSIFHPRDFNLQTFFNYLFNHNNRPLSPLIEMHQDMSFPLSHYFIYTGHNSYLTGNQLASDSSDVPIINALQRGVRVIELDLWPNASMDNVEVRHGGTLTSPVALIKCLSSIKEYAFVASEYPIVISLEDHLTPNLQAKVAEMVTQTFGGILFYPSSKSLKELPSPESLKRRIIISTKSLNEFLEDKEVQEKEEEFQKGKLADDEENIGDEDDLDYEEVEKSRQNASNEYGHLIAIHAGKPKGGLEKCLKVDPNKVRHLSLSELQLEEAAKTHGKEIVRFTQRNILRVYPKSVRLDSSNYNPLIGWMHGAQMVAFNMQGYAKYLWLMHGMFKANGGCGYVKKPDFLSKARPNNEVFDPIAHLPVMTTLKVTIYMGEGWFHDFKHTHFDRFSAPDFFVKVGIAGVPYDTVMRKTKCVENNWSPSWNEVFEFPLTVPELALLRVQVHEYDMSDKDDFGGQTCLPVWELRSGIRTVPLHSCKGDQYNNVKLLMRFEFI